MEETRKYKQTELGLLPEDWEVVKLGEIFRFISNNTFSRDFLCEDGEIKNIHYGDVLIKYGSTLDVSQSDIPAINTEILPSYQPKCFAEDGDIIIADTAEDETVCKATELWNIGGKQVVAGLHTMWCRPAQNTFAIRFLGYFMNTSLYHNQVLPLIQGIKVSSVSKSAIQGTWLCIPPIEEQRRIASALTSIDNLIDSLDRLIAKKRAIKQGVMQQLLSGKKRLKGFTEPWKIYKIDDLFDIGNGYTPSKANSAYWTNGTIPWFRMEDIRANGRILKDSIQHITEEAVKNSGLFPANSIILSTTATIGEHALLIADSLANQRFSFLIRKLNRCSDIDIMFFFYYCFILGEWCRANINDGGLMAVNMTDLKNYTFSAPSLPEQQAIASVLTSMDNELSALEAKRKKYEQIKQGMMQQLLTGRIRLN